MKKYGWTIRETDDQEYKKLCRLIIEKEEAKSENNKVSLVDFVSQYQDVNRGRG
ncbi:hypothetical protein [Listeria monocytogenes]|nr:hypothetical protein [Listeria monocytogenes]